MNSRNTKKKLIYLIIQLVFKEMTFFSLTEASRNQFVQRPHRLEIYFISSTASFLLFEKLFLKNAPLMAKSIYTHHLFIAKCHNGPRRQQQ